MLLRLRKTTSAEDLESLLAVASDLGYRTRFLDRGRRVLELEREPRGAPGRPGDRAAFEDLACVEGVLDASDAPELVERTEGRADTVVRVGAAAFGGGLASLIAGPCAVEDEDDLLAIARAVRDAGATLLRGGAFKPRTSPYSFRGRGRRGLESLARVKREVGLPVVTEVLDPRDVEAVAAVADMLQLGSRSMSNAALLTEAGRAGRPILLKRGLSATAREFLLAAEYLLAAGAREVVLCERGVRGFDRATRNVLDLGMVAHLKTVTHLPVIVDPSHAAGRSDLVLPLARAGLAAGADGLIVEVHPRPHAVHSDGAQAIDLATLAEIRRSAELVLAIDGRRLATAAPAAGSVEKRAQEPVA
jgi:3-deoxy-7-phosphoheptulonate synthase